MPLLADPAGAALARGAGAAAVRAARRLRPRPRERGGARRRGRGLARAGAPATRSPAELTVSADARPPSPAEPAAPARRPPCPPNPTPRTPAPRRPRSRALAAVRLRAPLRLADRGGARCSRASSQRGQLRARLSDQAALRRRDRAARRRCARPATRCRSISASSCPGSRVRSRAARDRPSRRRGRAARALSQQVSDRLVHDHRRRSLLIVLGMPLVLFARDYLVAWVLGRIDLDMKIELCGRLLALPLRFHRDRSRGDLLARLMGRRGHARRARSRWCSTTSSRPR